MAVIAPTGYAIEQIDLTGASDEALRPFVEHAWLMEREAVPEDPPRPFEAIASRMRTYSSLFDRWRWGAWTADRKLVGNLVMHKSNTDNLDQRPMDLSVQPEHRRRGVGRALLGRALDTVGEGVGLMAEGWTTSRVPAGGAFAERLGAKAGLRMRASQLELASVDRARMKEWAATSPAGYRLEWTDAEVPDALMKYVVTAYRTMNTMPLDDLQQEEWKVTPEIVREWERLGRERGQKRLLVVAIDEAGDDAAGFTEVFYDPREPTVLHQGGTAVIPAHRGRGIGKWVKGRMTERVLRELPQARYIRTENAGSNAAMLAINVAMGFKPAWEQVIWQIGVPDLRQALEGRAP